jgi:glucoamylase
MSILHAPGWPGIRARWTSSAKSGVGTSLSTASRVWFSISHGILNEVYYPRVDQACIRDLGLIITDGHRFFSEEKRHAESKVIYPEEGVPLYRLINTCREMRYQLEKEIIADPRRDVLMQWTRFMPRSGAIRDYHLYVLLAPHIGNRGSDNTAWIGDYKGVEMLFAEREGTALALACSSSFLRRSAGFVGVSDGWQDLMNNKQMTWEYERAEKGNVAMCGEVDLAACGGEFVLTLGFGKNPAEAGNRALGGLIDGFEPARSEYVHEWQTWQGSLLSIDESGAEKNKLYRTSTAVLLTHEADSFPGGLIAGLSIPWGSAKGDDDLGGYHLVWPRDLVECAGGLLAAGAVEDVARVLRYLMSTQEADGHWPQNMWLDGSPYWSGMQMDETAFPILLVDLARREKMLDDKSLALQWPMVKKAAAFLVQNGPVTQQDRWEEDAGYSPFTLAVEIAALLAAGDIADLNGEPSVAVYLRETADVWNANVERWTYVTETDLAHKSGVDGYYVRIASPEVADASSPAKGFVPIKNRPLEWGSEPATHIVSPDALALVRFGLRAADDPRIVATVKVIDSLLKVHTPFGPAWHRYNDDGYGEHEDGSPFDGTGIGRVWPLLTGERAHYELAAGRRDKAENLLKTLEAFASEGGMISEQVWDSPDIPERELFFGRPSGSAMPLAWAHAEYVKLCRSLRDGRVFDMPLQTVERYVNKQTGSPYAIWRFNHKCREIPEKRILRVETLSSAIVHWSPDGWRTVYDSHTRDSGLGVHIADIPSERYSSGTTLNFTFFWTSVQRWEGTDFEVNVK